MWPSGARKAPYDEPTPMWWPNVERPERMPAIASSQMPPIESVRAPGFVAAFQKPVGEARARRC